ncbi:MAG: hypothetical protein WC043_03845 [Pseudobdellovibrionaceae bacterium]
MSHNHTDISDDNEPFYDDGGDQSIPLPVALMIGVALLSHMGTDKASPTTKPSFVKAAVAAPTQAIAPQLQRDAQGCVIYTASRSPACK